MKCRFKSPVDLGSSPCYATDIPVRKGQVPSPLLVCVPVCKREMKAACLIFAKLAEILQWKMWQKCQILFHCVVPALR